MCHELVGEAGDDEIYEQFLEHGGSSLENFLCREQSKSCRVPKPKEEL